MGGEVVDRRDSTSTPILVKHSGMGMEENNNAVGKLTPCCTDMTLPTAIFGLAAIKSNLGAFCVTG